jgi:hypothetical protein
MSPSGVGNTVDIGKFFFLLVESGPGGPELVGAEEQFMDPLQMREVGFGVGVGDTARRVAGVGGGDDAAVSSSLLDLDQEGPRDRRSVRAASRSSGTSEPNVCMSEICALTTRVNVGAA